MPLLTLPKYPGPAMSDMAKIYWRDVFHFLPPRTVYAMEFYFGRVVFISCIYTVLCFYPISRGNVYQITEKRVDFGSFSVQLSLHWSRVAKTLQLRRECCLTCCR